MNLKSLASAFLVTGVMACGGGSGGGGASGVDRNKTIGELSASEAMDLCEFIAESVPTPKRTIDCDGTPVEFGVDQAEIDEQIAECTAEISGLEGCDATVANAEDCSNAQSALFDGITDDEICEFLTNPPPSPAACEALDDNPSCNGGEDDTPPPGP